MQVLKAVSLVGSPGDGASEGALRVVSLKRDSSLSSLRLPPSPSNLTPSELLRLCIGHIKFP
jgi:hypothetical protein